MSNDPTNRTTPRDTFWTWAIILGLVAILVAWLASFGLP
jgi:hypothetical protein